MADSPISGLPAVTLPLAGTEEAPVVQGGITKKATAAELLAGAATAAQGDLANTALQPGGPLATPSSGTLTSCTGLPLTTGVTGLLPVASGGTGTATPGLVQGTNVTITGSWPNQTINASGGGGSVLSVTGTAPIVSSGGTAPAISITPASGSAAGSMSLTDFTKLAGVATGATANATDAQLRDRTTHTGTQIASTISDFNASSRAQTEAALLAGTNVTLTPAGTGATRTITIAATAGGGGVSSVTGTAPIASSGGSTPAISIAAASGVTAGSMSSADFTKLAGMAPGATANLGTVTNTTGTAPIQVATGTTTPVISITAATTGAAGSMSGADKTKLDGIATGATANSTDAQLRDRSTHTGTQPAATISDFPASSRAQTEAMLTAGTNVTLTPSGTGATRSIQISATAGGGGVSTVTATAPITSTGGGSPDIGIVPASGTVPGSMSAANFTKLAGIATGATANATDAQLRDRTTHTGTQPAASITSAANLPVIANATGNLTAGAFSNTAGTYCEGNDARLSDARTPTAHNQAWSTITATPTTLAGYGIADAQPLDSDLTAIAALTTTAYGRSQLAIVDAAADTAQLNLFTSALKGLVPLSGGGTTNFLRADGTWVAPPGGGGGSPGGSTTQGQFNNAGAFAGSSGLIFDTTSTRPTQISFLPIATPATPASGFSLFAQTTTDRFSWVTPDGFVREFNASGNTASRSWILPDRAGTLSTDDFAHGTITYAASIGLDFAARAGAIWTVSLTGNLTFTGSNYALGKVFSIRLICDGTLRTLTFPANWKFVGARPVNIAATRTALFTCQCFGTTEADVVVGYAVQQ